jgi:asparagine synthase (glutamine-hydrolysing)
VRSPFLAPRVVEHAFSLPDAYRMRGLTGKRMLRDAVCDLLPQQILKRPKKGFGIPVAAWLNGALRPLAHDLLGEAAVRRAGLFEPREVQRLLDQHSRMERDNRKQLWTLLVFELWRREHIVSRVTAPVHGFRDA